VSRLGQLVSRVSQGARHPVACGFFVVGDEDAEVRHYEQGSRTVKVAPVRGPLSHRISPPNSRRRRLTAYSPKPVPLSLVVTKGSKIRSSIAAGIPAPSSLTEAIRQPFS